MQIRKQYSIAYQVLELLQEVPDDDIDKQYEVSKHFDNFARTELKNMLDVSSQTEKMLKLTGLVNYKNCYPRELSGGMRQRCAFGRALIHNPKILLLDQPFGALDAITRKILGIELLKIWKEQKKTIVMITNSVPEALMLGQRILVMSSAPGNITHEVINHIPYEKRFEDLGDNEKYKLLAEKLNTYVHEKKRYS